MQEQILNNLKLVNYVISKMNVCQSFCYDDLYQEGSIGLIKAVNSYDKNKKTNFSTYAYVCIKNEILKYIKKNNTYCISLDTEICDDVIFKDMIIDKNANIEEIIIRTESNKILEKILNEELTDIERKIIRMIYGIDYPKYKQMEISQILDIPQYKLSKIKNDLLVKIRNYIIDKNYEL